MSAPWAELVAALVAAILAWWNGHYLGRKRTEQAFFANGGCPLRRVDCPKGTDRSEA